MAKKIEILENTLLKLLVRRGDDADRLNVTLSEGELGYTTDGKRLFVGDSQTPGGNVAGNIWKGERADVTTISDALSGDLAYQSTNQTLYVNASGTDWHPVARIFTAADGSVVIDETAGTIAVGTLSSQHLSGATDLVGNSIELVNGQFSLSSTQIKTNRVSTYSGTHLNLPQLLNINNQDYSFPTGGLGGANSFLKADANGGLTWAAPESNANLFFNSSAAAIPVGGMVESATLSSMPTGWLVANGQTVAGADYPDLSAAIGDIYGGNGTTFTLPDESANGYVFIKALPDTVVSPSFSVAGGLSATVDGSEVAEGDSFTPLASNVVIQPIVPGMEVFDTAGATTFTTKAPYTKFWVTGSGATGGNFSGGAAATVYGVLSAPIGTTVNLTVGAGVSTIHTDGNPSFISVGGTELARSNGAYAVLNRTTWHSALTANGGSSLPTDPHVLSVSMLSGAWGGMDTNGGYEEAHGNASFWGGAGAPGAAGHSEGGEFGYTAAGMVKFEWGI